ncbi:hypothetical protein CECT5772_09712 [Streptococcus equi subsp. ruminatorum CECT 5772]|uniref:Uncharacterized protein n=1 Tax=Streptococcus equi subsp. ruminatorum CECT 5772 TaxID=1051981 RepID=A0A922NS64_9STRE|nr:hypothetical protein CECT5772_09712 [Streptococcus equi subsp. ruminatorum CECT 5772]
MSRSLFYWPKLSIDTISSRGLSQVFCPAEPLSTSLYS